MVERSEDWLAQAERDLESARWQLQGGYYEWVCFASQQAAEKAVKALYQHLHAMACGHMVSRLLSELPETIRPDTELIEQAIYLDRYYIAPRYPNGFERGAPKDYYTRRDAEEAISYAESVLRFCRGHIPGQR
ncbi:MAG: HEPN domain-containing protein [Deltaproteobacteria bacterium]|nr:HEPN domain-containing protein [Deltaproteobacteria bacterium]